jgi:hypothetical protein
MRRTAVAPATVRVPLIVLFPANWTVKNPAVDGAEIVMLLNVLLPPEN